MADEEAVETSPGILQEIFTSPLNLSLLCLCLFLLYKIVRGDKPPDMGEIEEPLPKLKKRDFTLAELKQYDGTANPRILMAVNGKVFDVTRGKKFYGPGKFHCAIFFTVKGCYKVLQFLFSVAAWLLNHCAYFASWQAFVWTLGR